MSTYDSRGDISGNVLSRKFVLALTRHVEMREWLTLVVVWSTVVVVGTVEVTVSVFQYVIDCIKCLY